jgi:uncharacterized membrane protein YkoI
MNPLRKVLLGSALAGSALVGGAIGASLLGTAGAQTPDSSTSTTAAASTSKDATANTTTADNDGDHGGGQGGPHQANGITEAALTGSDLTKATDAAKAAVPGGTVERAETDAEGAAYEVHMTKADGSDVTVKLDSSFKVTDTLAGRG